jgi:hypothetical protein
MEIDISIRNATPEELQRLFAKFEATREVNKIAPSSMPGRVLYPNQGTGSAPVTLPKGTLVNTLVMKKKTGNRYSNKWGIPIDSVKEPAKYEFARKICKRFGKPYAEAIKLKEAEDVKQRQKMPVTGIPAKGSKSETKPKKESSAAVSKPPKKKNNRQEQSRTKLERSATANKLQIPFDWKTQKQEYQKAWYLCKKYNKPYPEALALSLTTGEVKKRGKRGKRTGRQIPCPYCQKGYNSYGMHMHVKGVHPDKYDEFMKDPDRLHHGIHQETKKVEDGSGGQTGSADGGHKTTPDIKTKAPQRHQTPHLPFHQKKPDAPVHNVATTATHYDPDCPECQEEPVTEDTALHGEEDEDDVKIEGADSLASVMPETRPPTGPAERREAAAAMAGLKIGDQVRQIGGPRILFGVGTVKRLPSDKPDEVLIGFDNGTEWMLKKNLAPVEAKA